MSRVYRGELEDEGANKAFVWNRERKEDVEGCTHEGKSGQKGKSPVARHTE